MTDRHNQVKIQFKSNCCIAVHLRNFKKAEEFYSNVMGFRLKNKTKKCLVYYTGLLELYVVKDNKDRPPIPSFTVKNLEKAKIYLIANGCRIVSQNKAWLYFEDPNGLVFDIIAESSTKGSK